MHTSSRQNVERRASWAAGDTNSGDTTGLSLSGFGTHVPYRNGFRRLRIVDTTNISRVEVIKGPPYI
jgi:outer membrane receptor protein involved in Fe transport